MRARFAFLLLSILFMIGVTACGEDPLAAQRVEWPTESNPGEVGANITIKSLRFTPAKVTIQTGQSVVWDMNASIGHDLKVDGIISQIVQSGEFRRTFRTEGVYSFICTLHSGMTGEVIVQ